LIYFQRCSQLHHPRHARYDHDSVAAFSIEVIPQDADYNLSPNVRCSAFCPTSTQNVIARFVGAPLVGPNRGRFGPVWMLWRRPCRRGGRAQGPPLRNAVFATPPHRGPCFVPAGRIFANNGEGGHLIARLQIGNGLLGEIAHPRPRETPTANMHNHERQPKSEGGQRRAAGPLRDVPIANLSIKIKSEPFMLLGAEARRNATKYRGSPLC
jgi:hypothetical protein